MRSSTSNLKRRKQSVIIVRPVLSIIVRKICVHVIGKAKNKQKGEIYLIS